MWSVFEPYAESIIPSIEFGIRFVRHSVCSAFGSCTPLMSHETSVINSPPPTAKIKYGPELDIFLLDNLTCFYFIV